jgi:hypothetical protein
MALALQARDREFQTRLKDAFHLLASNPAAALSELEWAEQEQPALERERTEFDAAMENVRIQAGIVLTPQEAAVRNQMAATSHNAWLQIQWGKASALVSLNRLAEARVVVDAASAALGPESDPQARSMLLQMRASIVAAAAQGL